MAAQGKHSTWGLAETSPIAMSLKQIQSQDSVSLTLFWSIPHCNSVITIPESFSLTMSAILWNFGALSFLLLVFFSHTSVIL